MQEFSLFERSLILSKDARSPRPCADFASATRAHRRAESSEVALRSAPKSRPLRGYGPEALLGGGGPGNAGEVLGHSPLKSTPRALAAGESGQGRRNNGTGFLGYSGRISPPGGVR